MRLPRKSTQFRASSVPKLRFEDQALTSFSGLIVFQELFSVIGLKSLLRRVTSHLTRSTSYSQEKILVLLIVHLAMGWRFLRDLAYYEDDPIVLRVLGLKKMPNVSTVSRALSSFDARTVAKLRTTVTDLVVSGVLDSNVKRVTLDFDGSVISTKSRRAEGTAIGYNRRSKGARSYYPLFCTVAQTGQVFDVLHRPGNVHDSNGAPDFIRDCVEKLRSSGFGGVIEARMDGAHYNKETCLWLADNNVDFSTSVPFMRLDELKDMVDDRERWSRIDGDWSFFECRWKPKSWDRKLRIIVYRQRVKTPKKGPIQLHLFEPIHRHYEYKVVVTNKTSSPKAVLKFHNGRGSQEGTFAELKSHLNIDYIPFRRLIPNQIFLLAGVLAHNLARQMQMLLCPPSRGTTATRACLWVFDRVQTFRKRVIQRAGRLTRPNGSLTLTMSGNEKAARELMEILKKLDNAA